MGDKEYDGWDWDRGYYCAVAVLLRTEGVVSTEVKELFSACGSDVNKADEEDKKLFREYGLMT